MKTFLLELSDKQQIHIVSVNLHYLTTHQLFQVSFEKIEWYLILQIERPIYATLSVLFGVKGNDTISEMMVGKIEHCSRSIYPGTVLH